jgi:hypothetical protein
LTEVVADCGAWMAAPRLAATDWASCTAASRLKVAVTWLPDVVLVGVFQVPGPGRTVAGRVEVGGG